MAETEGVAIEVSETGADEAAAELENLRSKIVADIASVKELTLAMQKLQSGGSVNIEAFKNLKGQLDQTKASISQNKSIFSDLGGDMKKLAPAASSAGEAAKESGASIEALGQSVKGALGPMGGLIERGQALVKGLGKAGAAGVIAIVVAAILVLTAALIGAAIAFTKFAIATADAFRNQRIAIEELGLSTEEAIRLGKTMDQLRRQTGVSVEDQTKLLKQLKDAHIDVGDAAMKAMAIAKAGGGDDAVKELIKDLQNGKSAAQALADTQKKFGKIVEEKMLSLDAQTSKFSDDIKALFKDIAIEPFLKALQQLLSLFDQNTAFGRALHTIVTAIGNALVRWATAAIPHIISGMKTLLIWGLKAYIAFKQFQQTTAFAVIVFALKAIAVVLGVLIAASAAFMATMATPFILMAALIGVVIYLTGALIDGLSSLWDTVSSGFSGALDAVTGFVGGFIDAGAEIVNGLIQGVMGMGGAFISSLVSLAKSGLKAVVGALGIGSPSKEFMKLGRFAGQGLAGGIDSQEGNVSSSAESMANSALGGGAAGSASVVAQKSGGGRGGNTYNFTINGVKNAEELKSPSFLAQLAEAIEMAGTEAGAAYAG